MTTNVFDISISPLKEDAIYPNDPPTVLTTLGEIWDLGYQLTCLQMSLHAGTHIDFPAHFIRGGKQAGEYSLDTYFMTAQVTDGDQAFTAAAALQPGEALLVRTRQTGRENSLVFDLELARVCTDKQLGLVGIDQLSIEESSDGSFPVHHTLLASGVLILENLDLSKVENGKYQLICLPLKTEKTEAAPVRAVLLPLQEGWLLR
ncbi:MAG: cyclase family protein [Methylocystaceae bacterium]